MSGDVPRQDAGMGLCVLGAIVVVVLATLGTMPDVSQAAAVRIDGSLGVRGALSLDGSVVGMHEGGLSGGGPDRCRCQVRSAIVEWAFGDPASGMPLKAQAMDGTYAYAWAVAQSPLRVVVSSGNDSIHVDDGSPGDVVTCVVSGVDTVIANPGDIIGRDCEHVRRTNNDTVVA